MTRPQGAPFDEELAFYEANRDRFLREHANRHLLIKGSELIASFRAHGDAVGEGVRRFGRGSFLVRLSGEDTPVASNPKLQLGVPLQSGTS